MSVEASLVSALQVFGERVAAQGHEEDAFQSVVDAEGARDLVTVHARQADIAKHDLWLELPGPGQPLGTVVRDLDDVATECEHLAQAVGCVDIVLDD